jgi:hypothetical protein
MLSDEQAREDYCEMVNNRRAEPKLIKWTPSRLEYSGKGNTVAVGLSCGFVEPMEANALFTIVTSIITLDKTIKQYKETNTFDFTYYNDIMGYAIDDIADFILVHYTLSPRHNNEFWNTMRDIGRKENHLDLLYEKYKDRRNNMKSALMEMRTIFPDYMWANLADGWGLDLAKWQDQTIDPTFVDLSRSYFKNLEKLHKTASQTGTNNYQWLKHNVFQGLEYKEWMERFILNK